MPPLQLQESQHNSP
jgi:hypothetical protein